MSGFLNTSTSSLDSTVAASSGPCSAYESFSLISGLPLQIECITGYGEYYICCYFKINVSEVVTAGN